MVRRLLRDPDWEVRVADHRPAPVWMREGCEIAVGDLRDPGQAATALTGCSHVIHLAEITAGTDNSHTLTQVNNALTGSVVAVAIDQAVERCVYVSSASVFENATEFPTTEAHLRHCAAPQSAYGFSKLTGEFYVRTAHEQRGLPYTICRPFDPYGPDTPPLHGRASSVGEQTRTPTHVDDIADGIVAAMASPAGANEDFNISAHDERRVAEIARMIWELSGRQPEEFTAEDLRPFEYDVQRRWPSVEKARRLLGWEAKIGLREGIAATIEAHRPAPLSAGR